MSYRLLAAFFAFCFLHFSAVAQVTYEGCIDFRGMPVASVMDNSINDVAVAHISNGQPLIRYSTQVLAMLSAPTRRFFYVHECAHHALAHTAAAPSLQNERQADCWAARTMRSQLGFSNSDLQAVSADIARVGRADWTHLPGPYRVIDINACFNVVDGSSNRHVPPPPPSSFGFPPGYGMQLCGCQAGYPSVSPEPRCQSGSVTPVQCPGFCPDGRPLIGFVCQ